MKTANTALAIAFSLMTFQACAEDSIARSTFTTAIDNREPVDEVTAIDTDTQKVYYFTDIRGLNGQTITHRWEQNGEVQATVNFNVGGDRWRVWSSKNMKPELTGEWQVLVVDEAGNVLAQNSFSYGEASQPATAAESQAAAETQTPSSETTPAVNEEELSKIAPAAGTATEVKSSSSDKAE